MYMCVYCSVTVYDNEKNLKSNDTVTNYFTIFLQTIDMASLLLVFI